MHKNDNLLIRVQKKEDKYKCTSMTVHLAQLEERKTLNLLKSCLPYMILA